MGLRSVVISGYSGYKEKTKESCSELIELGAAFFLPSSFPKKTLLSWADLAIF